MSNLQNAAEKGIKLRQALEDPSILEGETLAYRNATTEIIRTLSLARVFEYVVGEEKWLIYDIMRDYRPEYFLHHFTRQEVLRNDDFF